MQLNERLNECACNLNDGKLLALLSGGDVVALELKYHCSCLTALYNRERAHIAAENKEKLQSSQEKEAFPLVFSELLKYVIETNKKTVMSPLCSDLLNWLVFTGRALSSLGQTYLT